MQINNIGYKFTHKRGFEVNRPNGSGDYMLLIIRSEAEFILNGNRERAFPGCIILYSKGTAQHYIATDEVFSNDWIHFDMTEDEAKRLYDMQIPLDSLVSLEDTKELSQIVKTMYQEKYSVNYYRDRTLQIYFELLCIKISEKIRCAGQLQSSLNYTKLSGIRTDIYNHPEKPRSVKTLAGEAMMSESYFQHLYKRFFGTSVVCDIITSRVEHGKYLLSATDMLISSIADECGYKNDVQFMRQFKTLAGMTPSEYRRHFSVSRKELEQGSEKQPYNL